MNVLQKLLMPWQARDVLERGATMVGGPVVRAGDALALNTPEALLRAFRLGADRFGALPKEVVVVRFEMVPLMQTDSPTKGRKPDDPVPEVPWPSYPNGFLQAPPIVPVWLLHRTRWTRGAEVWRIDADTKQTPLTVYDGAARGWRGVGTYRPPSPLVGPRVRWRGQEYTADILGSTADRFELIALGEQAPGEGFTRTRPKVWVQTVDRGDCEQIFERVITCRWKDAEWRVVDRDAVKARLLLQDPTPQDVLRTGADEIEPGVYEATAPMDEVTDIGGFTKELPVQKPSGTTPSPEAPSDTDPAV